jgi:hypothetical protein
VDTTRRSQTLAEPVRRRFAKYGAFGGTLLGALIGAVFSGPHIREWELGTSLLVTLGFAGSGLLLGYIAEIVAKTSLTDGGASGGFGGRHGIGSEGDNDSDHDDGGGGGAGTEGGGGGTS